MNKISFRFIIAAMSAISVFSSCQKELVNETASSTTDGVRTISVQFDNPTKATIDGFTPKFENGDQIRVSNDTESEVCTVSVDGSGNAIFATTLSGALTAIYPSSAAVLSTGAADAPIATSNNIKVPASQDGTARNAIIAKATIAAKSTSASFRVQTALFEITPPSGATSITITSLQTVDSGGARTGTAVAINTDGATDAEKLVINVAVPSGGKSYVSLVPGVKLSDLSFDAGTSYGTKEISVTAITTAGKSDITAANTKYTINGTGWKMLVDYVEIGGKKWATMNLGATTVATSYSTCYGDLYQWGSVNTLYEGSPYTSATAASFAWKVGKGSGFVDENKEYTGDAATLPDAYDVVKQTYPGTDWRMPTAQEFQDLYDACVNGSYDTSRYASTLCGESTPIPSKGVYWCGNYDGVAGCLFYDGINKLFFPAVGYGGGSSLSEAGSIGDYWSSTWFSSSEAYYLRFNGGDVRPKRNYNRYFGRSVRPVSD